MNQLKGKVAIITGASQGCGEVTAKLFADEGACVAICDINDNDGQRVRDEINKVHPNQVIFCHMDVGERRDWEKTIHDVIDQFGELNIVINNAGISFRETVMDMNDEIWDKTLHVNQKGVALGMKYGIEAIAQNNHPGAIISTASVDGHTGDSVFFTYCATKAAVEAMTRCAALYCCENGINCRVNAVGPGYMYTPMAEEDARQNNQTLEEYCANSIALHPIGRLADPIEIANAYLWLASNKSSYVTGTTLMVDGGYTAK